MVMNEFAKHSPSTYLFFNKSASTCNISPGAASHSDYLI